MCSCLVLKIHTDSFLGYLKSYTTGAPSSGVDGAQLISGPSGPSSGSPTQSSTAGTSVASETGTQSVSSSTATSTATPGSASCQQLGDEYTDAFNRTYTVQCGFDHQGGDLKAVSSNSFQGCFPQCDATAGCVGFAYVGGSGPGTCCKLRCANGKGRLLTIRQISRTKSQPETQTLTLSSHSRTLLALLPVARHPAQPLDLHRAR